MNLKFKTLEDANAVSAELGGPAFETLEEARMFEFASNLLAKRIANRKHLKDHVKSKESSKQMASDLAKAGVSKALKRFNQTAVGKRLRQRVTQMRKAGAYDKLEALQVLTNVQSALINEARYSRELTDEVHTELVVESVLGLLTPIVDALTEDQIDARHMTVLMNSGMLAESMDTLLGITEDAVGGYKLSISDDEECNEDDPCWDGYEQAGMKEKDGKQVPNCVPESITVGTSAEPVMLIDICESVKRGAIVESIDTSHGQLSTKEFNVIEGENGLPPGVLARREGPAFFLDSISRNKRFYSAKVWEKACSTAEFKERLARRVVYGTIGHDVEINEDAIRKGLVSHIVSGIRIDPIDKIGYATYDILNSASGRELNVLLEAGSGIKTSTRAYGQLAKNERVADLPDGVDIIDANDFTLSGIDFVLDPGFMGSEVM